MVASNVPVSASQKPLFVHTKLTHRNPDVDDVIGIFLFGCTETSEYVNTAQAGIRLYDGRDRIGKTAEQLEAEGEVAFGILNGWADEHPDVGKPRIEGDCCASQVSKRMGLDRLPEYSKLVSYAQVQNNSALGGEWDLGPLLKAAFRYCCDGENGEKEQRISDVFYAASIFLSAILHNERSVIANKQPPCSVPFSMNDIIVSWLASTGNEEFIAPHRSYVNGDPKQFGARRIAAKLMVLEEHPEMNRILEYARLNQRVDNTWSDSKFDLVTMIRLAFLHNTASEKEIVEAAHVFLKALHRKELSFQHRVRATWNNPDETDHRYVQTMVTTPRGRDRLFEFRLTTGLNREFEFQKFCRSNEGGRAAIVIQRQGTYAKGNTQIFFQQDLGFDPAPFTARIREAQRFHNGCTDAVTEEELRSQGNHVPGATNIYFDGHQILNGSGTNEAEPMKLDIELVILIVYDEANHQAPEVAEKLFAQELHKLEASRQRLLTELHALDFKM